MDGWMTCDFYILFNSIPNKKNSSIPLLSGALFSFEIHVSCVLYETRVFLYNNLKNLDLSS